MKDQYATNGITIWNKAGDHMGIFSAVSILNDNEREIQKLKTELQATEEQLEIAEEILSVQVTESAIRYFEDKQKDEVK